MGAFRSLSREVSCTVRELTLISLNIFIWGLSYSNILLFAYRHTNEHVRSVIMHFQMTNARSYLPDMMRIRILLRITLEFVN